MKIKIVAFKASKRTMALILISILLIISVIGLVDYKSAFEDAQASAVKWHSLSDQYLVELKEANRELDTANEEIGELWGRIGGLNFELATANKEIGIIKSEITSLKKGGKDFNSLWALKSWLRVDGTNWHEYISGVYDCDDYAIDLVQAALEDGYRIGLFQRGQHVVNFAYVGGTTWGLANEVYIIEPQTDEVRFWGYRD